MGQNNIAGSILQVLLGWVQSLFNGVWSLFSGGSGGSLLRWLSDSWLSLLVFFLLVGVVMDVFIYLVRWRPFWWWFRKKRMVIDDEAFAPSGKPKKRKPAPPQRKRPSTIAPKRIDPNSIEDDDALFMEDDVFEVRPKKKKKDPFEVEASHRTARRTAHR